VEIPPAAPWRRWGWWRVVWCQGGLLRRWSSWGLVVVALDLRGLEARRGARVLRPPVGSILAADLAAGTQGWASSVDPVCIDVEDGCGKVE
jgi:hypothetical protein